MSDPIDLILLAKAIQWWNKEMRVPSPSPPRPVIVLGSAANRVLEADQLWKCVSHNCDVKELNEKFNPREEYCAIESEWGSLDPENCKIVRGVFVPVKASA